MPKYSRKKIFKKVAKQFNGNGLVILLSSLFIIASFLSGILFEKTTNLNSQQNNVNVNNEIKDENLVALQNKVLKDKYIFNIKWADLGKKMVEDGVIDKTVLAQSIAGTDILPKDLDKYFTGDQNKIEVNQENAQFWVDVLWGLGLANKNKILEEGDMMMEDDPSIFASTGGYSLSNGDPMDHYSKHSYIILSEEEQKTVSEIAGNIYRPCCGNSTAFPDCNHGMAMLGLIELMVSLGKSPDEIYKTALAFNTYWFPQTYLETSLYLDKNGQDYSKVSAQQLLSQKFSSVGRDEAISLETQGANWPILGGEGGSCGA